MKATSYPAEHLFSVGDATLCIQTFGDPAAPAVLLVAGTSCSMDWWPPEFCMCLAERGLHVVRFDQRDTGRSTQDPSGAPSYSLRSLVTDAVGVPEALRIPAAHWVGFSQGGWVSQLAALDHPTKVESLTLISTRPTGHGPADPDLPEVADKLMMEWENLAEPDWTDSAAVIDYLVRGERSLAADPFDADAALAICTSCVARTPDLQAAVTNHPIADQGSRWRERLHEIDVPTLVLHGDRDPLFPLDNARALAAEIPHAQLTTLPSTGHELPSRAWHTIINSFPK